MPAGVTLVWLAVTHRAGADGYVIGGLAFIGSLVLLIVVGVFVVMVRDPSRLMLGTISGSEYHMIQQLTQGDSLSGERKETIAPRPLRPGGSLELEGVHTPIEDAGDKS